MLQQECYQICSCRRYQVVGDYIPPSETNRSTLAAIQTASWKPEGSNTSLILLGADLNCNFDDLGDSTQIGANCRTETAALVDSLGLTSMRLSFRQQRKGWVQRFWTLMQCRNGALVGLVCDHILTDTRSNFQTVSCNRVNDCR